MGAREASGLLPRRVLADRAVTPAFRSVGTGPRSPPGRAVRSGGLWSFRARPGMPGGFRDRRGTGRGKPRTGVPPQMVVDRAVTPEFRSVGANPRTAAGARREKRG